MIYRWLSHQLCFHCNAFRILNWLLDHVNTGTSPYPWNGHLLLSAENIAVKHLACLMQISSVYRQPLVWNHLVKKMLIITASQSEILIDQFPLSVKIPLEWNLIWFDDLLIVSHILILIISQEISTVHAPLRRLQTRASTRKQMMNHRSLVSHRFAIFISNQRRQHSGTESKFLWFSSKTNSA